MPRRAAWVLLCLLPPLGGVARAEEVPGAAQREMAVLAAVPAAVAKGARYVAGCQRDGGAFDGFGEAGATTRTERLHRFGKTALATLTLLHCGRPPDDPAVVEGLRFLRRRWREAMSGRGLESGATYSLSLFVMTLQLLGERAAAAGEAPARITLSNPLGLTSWARTAVRSVHRWLLRTRGSDGLYSYPLRSAGANQAAAWWTASDLSNTQYAMLGLWAGTLCGERVEGGTLEALAEALLAAQQQRGRYVRRVTDDDARRKDIDPATVVRDRARGFSYRSLSMGVFQPVTGAMTAGGLSSLLIAKALLQDHGEIDEGLGARLDRGIWDSIAWLTLHFDVARNPVGYGGANIPDAVRKQFEARGDVIDSAGWHAYYLYALERALVIGGKRFLGARDWYVEGAERLLSSQAADGSWRDGVREGAVGLGRGMYPDPLVDTCFSLLFLKRASLRPRSPLLAR